MNFVVTRLTAGSTKPPLFSCLNEYPKYKAFFRYAASCRFDLWCEFPLTYVQVAAAPSGHTTAIIQQQTASRKVTTMCLAITAVFTMTSLPFQTDVCVVGYAPKPISDVANRFQMYFRTGAMLNMCINPVIYGLMWRPFRTALVKVCVISFYCFQLG